MFRRRWWAPVTGDVVEDGAHPVQHIVALSQSAAIFQRNPGALVLSIAALHLLVDALLDLALEDAGAGGLVVVGHLEDMGRIDPVVGAASHDMVAIDVAFINGHLRDVSTLSQSGRSAQAAL